MTGRDCTNWSYRATLGPCVQKGEVSTGSSLRISHNLYVAGRVSFPVDQTPVLCAADMLWLANSQPFVQ